MALFTAVAAGIASVGAWVGTLSATSLFALQTAAGLGLNLIAQAVAGKPKPQTSVINTNMQGGGDVPRSFILGRYMTPGSLVYANTWGKEKDVDNAYLTQVIALSDIPIKGLVELWVNGEKVEINWNDTSYAQGFPIPAYSKDGGTDNQLWIRFYDGNQTAPDPWLSTVPVKSGRSWDGNRLGDGVAYAIVTAQINGNLFSGIPAYKFVIDGIRLYNPAEDSTVEGGNGPQRWADRSTWGGEGDRNPIVQAYNLALGLTYKGTWVYGFQGMTASRLPAAPIVKQIKKCDVIENGKPIYRSSGEVSVDTPFSDVLDAIMTTCQGRIAEVGGVYTMFAGEPDNPVIHFTDGEILTTEGQSFTPFFGLADTITGIAATYPSPAEGWAVRSAPSIFRSDLEAMAGNRRMMADVMLAYVTDDEQVQRLMKSALLEGQRARRHTITMPPSFWAYATPGAIFSWTSERNGYVNKLFRVDGVIDKANLDVMIDMTEVDPSDYDWNSSTDYTPVADGALGPIRPSPQPIIDWFAAPSSIDDNSGKPRRPAILLSWDPDVTDVIGVEFEVRLAVTLETVYQGRTDQPQIGFINISQGLLPNVQYGVRGRYIPGSDRPVLWSNWLPVTTLDIRLGSDDLYPIDIDDLNLGIDEMWEWQNNAIRKAQDEQERIGEIVADINSGAFSDRQIMRRELTSTTANITASYKEEILVATGPGSAIAARIEEVRVELEGSISSAVDTISSEITDLDGRVTINTNAITSLTSQLDDKASATALTALSARVDSQDGEITAISSSVTAVTAKVDGVTAEGLLQVTSEATQAGALSRIGLSAKATAGGATTQAALFIEAITGNKSRIVLDANEVVFSNGSDRASPFIMTGGVAYLNELKVRWADIENLVANNFVATSANIGFAEIDSGNIAASAITNQVSASGSVSIAAGATQTVVGPTAIDSPTGKPITIGVKLDVTQANNTSGDNNHTIEIVRNGAVIYNTFLQGNGSGNNWVSPNWFTFIDPVGAGIYSYSVRVMKRATIGGSTSATCSIVLECNKR